jgi:hypothetical protein
LLESFFPLGIMLAKCTIAIVNHVWCSLHFTLVSYYALDNNNTQICRCCVGLRWDQSYTQMIAQRRKDQKDRVGRHNWNETEQQLVFDLIASAPGHLWASQTATSSRSTSSLLFLPFCCHQVENLSLTQICYIDFRQ